VDVDLHLHESEHVPCVFEVAQLALAALLDLDVEGVESLDLLPDGLPLVHQVAELSLELVALQLLVIRLSRQLGTVGYHHILILDVEERGWVLLIFLLLVSE
jgi:hypothetical protein